MAQLSAPTQDREQQQPCERKKGLEKGRGKSNDKIKGSRKGRLCGIDCGNDFVMEERRM